MFKAMAAGVTLIELMVVIGIIFLLFTIGLPSYNSIKENVALSNYSQEIVSALRSAQNRSIVSQNGTSHGVHFNSDSYVLFGGDWATPDYTTIYQLGGGLGVLEGEGREVIFDRLTGQTSGQTIIIGSAGGNPKTIQINETGKISIL